MKLQNKLTLSVQNNHKEKQEVKLLYKLNRGRDKGALVVMRPFGKRGGKKCFLISNQVKCCFY